MINRTSFIHLSRFTRAAAVIGGLVLLPGCTSDRTATPSSGDAAGRAPGGTSAADGVTTVPDMPAAVPIEHLAEAPPAGVPLPFPDAAVATDITPGTHGGQFTSVSFGEGPKTFNPITANDSGSNDVVNLMYSQLVGLDPVKQTFIPQLATEWVMNPEDKRVWTIKLRKGVQWSDGHPLTADDVIFTVETIYDTRFNSAFRDIMQINGEPIKFEKVDDHTVRATLPEPSGFFQTMLGFQVIPKHAYGPLVADGTFDSALAAGVSPEKLVVSGPFKLRLFQSGERVILERNPNYWRVDSKGTRLPYLDNFMIVYAPDRNQAQLRFERGDADGFERPLAAAIPDLRDKQQQGNYTLHELGPGMSTTFIWFNLKPGNNPDTGKPYVDPVKYAWFSDARFRKAMMHGINREAIIRTELRGQAVPAAGKVPSANKTWYNPNVSTYKYDRKQAGALLDEMGLTLKPGQKVRTDANGNQVSFTLITNKGNNERERVAGLVAQDLRGVGVDVRTQFLDFNALLTLTDSTYEYEACLLGLTGGGFDPASGMNAWLSNGRTNLYNPRQEQPFTEWQAEIDRLGKAMVASLDPQKQRDNYFKMQQISAEQLPLLALWHPKEFVPVRNKFGNVRPAILSPHLIWNADEFFVKP